MSASLNRNPLRLKDLSDTVPAVTLADRLRARIKTEMVRQHLSQHGLARKLREQTGEKWSQPRLAKVLRKRVRLRVDDVEVISGALRLSIVELVRDQGGEFFAELTPSELRAVQLFRQQPTALAAVLTLLQTATEPTTGRIKSRGAHLTETPESHIKRDRVGDSRGDARSLPSAAKAIQTSLGVLKAAAREALAPDREQIADPRPEVSGQRKRPAGGPRKPAR